MTSNDRGRACCVEEGDCSIDLWMFSTKVGQRLQGDDSRRRKWLLEVAATANGEMAVVGSGYCGGGISWERRATDGGKSHKKQRMQRQGRKKRQQLCNKLETIVAIADGATRRGRSGWPEIRSGHDRAERWGTSPLLLEYCNR
ncbi:hypothetical protein BHM03_00059493 [Ensete ventricosum]|nr:hypothetical protein BHM03_00059493 [Ensete ventricosum]